jgi:hypothetical protein
MLVAPGGIHPPDRPTLSLRHLRRSLDGGRYALISEAGECDVEVVCTRHSCDDAGALLPDPGCDL